MAEAVKTALKSNNYKLLKESFYQGHNGGSIWEINLVTAVLPIAILTWSACQSRLHIFATRGGTGSTPLPALALDWLLQCAAPLAALTVYSASPVLLNALLILPAVFLLISTPASAPRGQGFSASSKARAAAAATRKDRQRSAAASTSPSTKPLPASSAASDGSNTIAPPRSTLPLIPRKPCLTHFRGSLMVITCVAILAVDFPIFPRRFAKVENWGTSLMDLGVGSFVFSAGVISARQLFVSPSPPLLSRLRVALRQSLALLALGFIRLASVKGVDYAEHVTEYGVHWNFFFTLGFLPPFVALFQTLFNYLVPSYPILALLLAATYEVVLDWTGLTAYIIAAPRDNLISQNCEGICSFIGYLAIFLAGQGAGAYALPREKKQKLLLALASKNNNEQASSNESKPSSLVARTRELLGSSIAGQLLLSGLAYALLFTLTTSYGGFNLRVSRRMANLPYVLWIAAYNSLQLMVLVVIENFFFPSLYQDPSTAESASSFTAEQELARCSAATSPVLAAFNRNGLALFLLANLLTGAVNLALPTIHMGGASAMAILTAYMGVLGAVAVGLDAWNITIKI